MELLRSIFESLLDPKIGVPYAIIFVYSVYSLFLKKNCNKKSIENDNSLPVRIIFVLLNT